MHSISFVLLAVAASAVATDGAPLISNTCIEVRLQSGSGLPAVTDLRTGRSWPLRDTSPDAAPCALASTDVANRAFTLDTTFPAVRRSGEAARMPVSLDFALAADTPDLRVTLRFHPDGGDWAEVSWPHAFALTGSGGRFLLPHAEGLLTPLRRDHPDYMPIERDWIFSGYGTFCAGYGVTDMASGAGVFTYFDTPELAGYDLAEQTIDGTDVVVPRTFWRPSKWRFDAPRIVTFTFADTGAHVSLAMAYRRLYTAAGHYRSLRDKADANPNVDAFVGAPVFWIFDTPENTLATARMMREDGIEHALIQVGKSMHFWSWTKDEANLAALPAAVEGIRALGYAVSCYDQYRDAFKPDPEESVYHQINTDGYPDALVKYEDGVTPRPGWPPGFVMNPWEALKLAQAHIPADLAKHPWTARFMDCVGTCALMESEDWDPRHPCDAFSGFKGKCAILDYYASLGLPAGSEGAIDTFLSRLHWIETPMTLVRWTSPDFAAPGWNPVKPSAKYEVNISPRYRIPFYSLTHHDEVMITWRWEDGFQRVPEHWRTKELWTILYGNPALYAVDRANYESLRKEIVKSCLEVGAWTRRVGYSAMTDHRFLTEDQTVQETAFSTGERAVVNFRDTPFPLPGGGEIPARGYLLR